MKKLIIADVKSYNDKGRSTGHYFAIAQNYLELYKKYINTTVAGGPLYQSRFSSSDIFSLPYDSISEKSSIKNKWWTLMNCKHLFKKSDKEDIIVLQHSGASTTFLGIALFAKKKNNNNIYVIQYDTEALSSYIKRCIYKIAKNKIKGIICSSSNIGKSYKKEHCIVTDYIYADFNKKMEFHSLNSKKYDISMIGNISSDKGVIEAAHFLSNTKYKILIAGKADDILSDQLKKIAQTSSNIELHLGFIADNDYRKYIKESRYCLLNYRGVYSNRSSGVVLDILFNGIPIVGHRCSALSFIEKENIGYLFDNIEDLNIDLIMNENTYRNYQNKIQTYLIRQKTHRDKILDFLKINQ